ncbi:glycoside hydrolase family 70 protein [Lactobacillaceae bacterium Melli_B4]
MMKKMMWSFLTVSTLAFSLGVDQPSSVHASKTTNVSQFELNNRVYDHTSQSFTTFKGFLTADSWYRPKKILQNGQTWVKSTPNDKRPLLMNWWPDKQTQVNYLNFMNGKGYGKTPSWHTTDESQASLDLASELVQRDIENQISDSNGDTTWLKQLMKQFVISQDQWNIGSEHYSTATTDGFQGGFLKYGNSKYTPGANSNFRILNRYPNNQTGHYKYDDDGMSDGNEFLLANDVDNSNPAVQSEALNWVYYLTHFGDITQNNPNANFDGIRFDAVDNVDADLLNITGDYFKQEYQIHKNDQNANDHLSILEDWAGKDPNYMNDHGNNQLTMDSDQHFALINSLGIPTDKRLNMQHLNDYTIVDYRDNDYSENKATPNYSFMRAHDSGVQEILFQIIHDKFDHNYAGGAVNPTYLKKALKIYDADEKAANKQYTYYNIPSSYAFILTNKDTVPRVYYGDMYTDDGQFMSKKTPYFDSIKTLLEARPKYVAGGQQMRVQHGLLTSVRFGKGALKPKTAGNQTTRNSGIGVVIGNDPNQQLAPDDKVVLNMGAAHKNQDYQSLLTSSTNGVSSELGQQTKRTNVKGQLVFNAKDIQGYNTTDVSGYLSVWVPTSAKDDQDVRTKSTANPNHGKRTVRSNAALDSNVIFEAFSNFQSMPIKHSQYENVIIAKRAAEFKRWGITYMQLPPQYRSVDDNSFVDATIKNGYAFNDRYDLGFDTPTKYGTATELADTIATLHDLGIKSLADFVPNQLYDLSGKQLVSATRTDVNGKKIKGSNFNNRLYVANAIGPKDSYQAKYGGAFLATLKQQHPAIFTRKQISNHRRLVTNQPIKQWSAKYLNGTNLQGHGVNFVLQNEKNQKYYIVNKKVAYIPKAIE